MATKCPRVYGSESRKRSPKNLKPASGARAPTCSFSRRLRYLDPLNAYYPRDGRHVEGVPLTTRCCQTKFIPIHSTFVDTAVIEPTGNRAEQALRHPVILRKTSLGTASHHGSRFIEGIMTNVQSLRWQQRDVLALLTILCVL